MDVTPKLLEDVEFRAVFRGYDPEEVDDFLERVAVAFSQLHERLRDATEQLESANARTVRAEARARDSSEGDDTLRRTLVLAQRTADAAIKEAEESAAAIVSAAEAQARQHYAATEERANQLTQHTEESAQARESQAHEGAAERLRVADGQAQATLSNAREQASRLLVDARQKADRILADADTAAIRQAEQKLARLTEEVDSFELRRDALAEDVQTLDLHARTHRQRLTDVLNYLQEALDGPSALTQMNRPQLRSADLGFALEARAARLPADRDPIAPDVDSNATPSSFFAPTTSNLPVSAPGHGDEPAVATAVEATLGAAHTSHTAYTADEDAVIDIDALAAASATTDTSRDTDEADETDGPAGFEGHGRSDGSERPSRVPPQARPASERPSTGLRSPLEPGSTPSPAAPPWVGLAPPPPPPPPSGVSRADDNGADSSPGAPPPRPSATTVVLDQPRTDDEDSSGDNFLDELRRAVGDQQEDDEAIRFFEDRDPTDPAVRFFEGSEDLRSRFRRR
ncbi:MAG: DivIVA domain-containing protein [Acidimicrobiales bacterium]